MNSRKYGVSGLGRVGALACVAATLVAVACTGNTTEDVAGSAKKEPVKESVATESAALTGSCQALDIATHEKTNYAIKLNGEVWGWGFNGFPFPLGYNSVDPNHPLNATVTSPAFLGITGAKQIAASETGACALLSDGTVECLGQQLGGDALAQGQDPPPPSRVQVLNPDGTTPNLSGVIGITSGDAHACAWKADGTAYCWGDDSLGELADGTGASSNLYGASIYAVPVALNTGDFVVSVAAAGYTTCALLKTGVVECAGSNSAGQLGEGSGGNTGPNGGPAVQPTLTPVSGGLTFGSLFAGGHGTFCASTGTPGTPVPDGGTQTTYCWGLNGQGQALITNVNAANSPSTVSTDVNSTWAQGDSNGCELTSGGGIACWGMNSYGQIPGAGAGDILARTPITAVGNGLKVAIGNQHVCALSSNALTCWGNDADGEIGNAATAGATAPYKIHLSTTPAACGSNSCGIINNACGEPTDCLNCGGKVNGTSGPELCVNNQCVNNPGYCTYNNGGSIVPGCPGGDVCQNNTCVAYCGTNPITDGTVGTSVTMTSQGFSVTSPASYGSANCSAEWIIDISNSSGFGSRSFAANFAQPVSQADCANMRLSISTYLDGEDHPASGPTPSTNGYIYPHWVPGGGIISAYCAFDTHCVNGYCPTANEIALPYVPVTDPGGKVRVAISGEKSSVVKGQTVWNTVPVTGTVYALLH